MNSSDCRAWGVSTALEQFLASLELAVARILDLDPIARLKKNWINKQSIPTTGIRVVATVLSAVGALVAAVGPAKAQTIAPGPYYPNPSWDQTLACTTLANCPRFIVLLDPITSDEINPQNEENNPKNKKDSISGNSKKESLDDNNDEGSVAGSPVFSLVQIFN